MGRQRSTNQVRCPVCRQQLDRQYYEQWHVPCPQSDEDTSADETGTLGLIITSRAAVPALGDLSSEIVSISYSDAKYRVWLADGTPSALARWFRAASDKNGKRYSAHWRSIKVTTPLAKRVFAALELAAQ